MEEGNEIDPLSVNELIRQAKEAQKKWKKPNNEPEQLLKQGRGWPSHVGCART